MREIASTDEFEMFETDVAGILIIEHSGRVIRFKSWQHLERFVAFLEAALQEGSSGGPTGGSLAPVSSDAEGLTPLGENSSVLVVPNGVTCPICGRATELMTAGMCLDCHITG